LTDCGDGSSDPATPATPQAQPTHARTTRGGCRNWAASKAPTSRWFAWTNRSRP